MHPIHQKYELEKTGDPVPAFPVQVAIDHDDQWDDRSATSKSGEKLRNEILSSLSEEVGQQKRAEKAKAARERKSEWSAKYSAKIKDKREEISQSRNEKEEKYFRETGYCYLLARDKKLPDGWGANTSFTKFMHPDGRTVYRGLKAAKAAAMVEPS